MPKDAEIAKLADATIDTGKAEVEVRPELAGIDPAELSDYLLDLGIAAKTYLSEKGLVIEAKVPIDKELAVFVPTSRLDKTTFPFRSDYKPKEPEGIVRLRDFRARVLAGEKIDPAEVPSVMADMIEAVLRD